MRKYLLLAFLLLPAISFGQELVKCAPNVPCNSTTGPVSTKTGTPFWQWGGFFNDDISTLWSTQTTTGTGAYVLANGAAIDLTNATGSPPAAFPPCPPYTLLGNNTGSIATPDCDGSLNIASIVVGNTGVISSTGTGSISANQVA